MALREKYVPYKFLQLLLAILLVLSISLAANTLKQGETLNASSSLVYDNFFTLGFKRIGTEESNNNYLGIWLKNDPTSKPFWLGNRDKPIGDNSGKLSIDGSGALKLNYSGGDVEEFYSLGQSSSGNNLDVVLVLVLEETGDLVLRDASSGHVLWESFDDPVDSLLSGMKLGTNHRTGKSWTLVSWLTDSIPAPGAFTLEWNSGIQQLVLKRRGVTFWTTTPSYELKKKMLGVASSTKLNFSYSIVSNADEDYFMYTLAPNQFSDPGQRDFQVWRLQYDGSIVTPDLNVFTASLCDGNYAENGCKKWEGPVCRNGGARFELRAGWFYASTNDANSSLSISDCKDICWRNCSCVGTITYHSNDTGCFFYQGKFMQDLTGNALQYNVILRPKLPVSRYWIWILSTIAFALFLAAVTFLLHLRRKRNTKRRLLNELLRMDTREEGDDVENGDANNKGHNLILYGVTTITVATNNFSLENKLGQGGFGPVYKGKLQEGKEIAVKKLSKSSGQGMVEFKNELILIAKLQHTNLVRLFGFCIHAEEKMLVYEYMPNKSLDWFIFDDSKKKLLDWSNRMDIIEGIAQGMLYLHKYSRLRIIHRDLKASNILLDENLNPKISDFGMARIFGTNTIEANTNRVVGTYGYMSPEYAMGGVFSVKSNVFSFGVLLLEIISGKKNYGILNFDRPVNLVGYAWELWKRGDALELVDPTLIDSYTMDQALRCIQVGLLCVEDNALDRPTMSDVITMLTSEAFQLPYPKQPAFTNPRCVMEIIESNISDPIDGSRNEMTMSIIDAR